ATSTESPTRSGRAAGGSSSTIFTGTRWTTFTQLPEAFSGGRSEKTAPARELRLLEVRDDVEVEGDEGEQRGARLDALAHLDRPAGDDAPHRRGDGGVCEVQLGAAPGALGLAHRRAVVPAPRPLGAEHRLGALEAARGRVVTGARHVDGDARAVVVVDRDHALPVEARDAVELELRLLELGGG